MIKYVELTAPEANAYRQAKILSIECNEGDQVNAGDTLFIVQSGKAKLELPSTKSGRVVEFIVSEQQNITLSTPLLLLETVVDGSTATPQVGLDEQPVEPKLPTSSNTASDAKEGKKASKKNVRQPSKRHEQQSLDLLAGLDADSSANSTVPLHTGAKQHEPQTTDERLASGSEPEGTHATQVDTTENISMSDTTILTINVPDIGADSAKVIEILVQVGDEVAAEDALVTLESDKASMDVPCPESGRIKSISVEIDQDVSEGTALVELELVASNADANKAPEAEKPVTSSDDTATSVQTANESSESSLIEVRIPDIGGDAAKVVEVLVAVGDNVDVEDALVTLESDKASMDVPSSHSGRIASIELAVGDDVSEGALVVVLEGVQNNEASPASENTSKPAQSTTHSANQQTNKQPSQPAATSAKSEPVKPSASNAGVSHASPSIRRFARELGVDLSAVSGTGRKNRVTKDDIKSFVKGVMAQPSGAAAAAHSGGAGIPQVPAQDFSKFGEIDVQPLNKIKRLTASNLHRSWLNVPHVTHNDESNINDLESFRKQLNAEYAAQNKGIKLSPLAFIVKAVVNALQTYPQFNSSLEPGGENLIFKKYFHIGIAVETPNGLVVPVIRDADKKSVAEIAQEMGELAKKARDKKLSMNDMSGACFTISSLGGIGGTSFTPIVNAPEVAILGVSRSKIQPVWNGKEFTPAMMLPLSLSYDHRVIDGAEAARFTRHVAAILEDIRRLTV